MNVFDKIVVCLILISVIIWQALHQAKVFKQQKTISHFWKGVWYALAVAAITTPYVIFFDWWYLLKIPVIGIVERMAFFDPILNKSNNQSLFYNGPDVQEFKSKGSWLDRLENKLPDGVVIALKCAYVVAFVIIIIRIK